MTKTMNVAKFAKSFSASVTRTLVNLGYIDLTGKDEGEILQEIIEFLDNRGAELSLVVDHTRDLLSHARVFRKSNSELACLFYALWIEHTLNSMIQTLAARKGLNEKEVESLLRESSFRAKCSWILRFFDIRSIETSHMNAINKLMELRNSFVHYKWKPQNDQTTKELQLALNSIEKTVKYLKYFERNTLRSSRKGKCKRSCGNNRGRRVLRKDRRVHTLTRCDCDL